MLQLRGASSMVMYFAVGGRNPPPVASAVMWRELVEMTQEYVAMSPVTEPSVPMIACPSQMAWAMSAYGIVVLTPQFIIRISFICSVVC